LEVTSPYTSVIQPEGYFNVGEAILNEANNYYNV